ncbi:hypothetical protein ACA910_013049 [Epithemia clementina (nom. ined.)]
MGLTLTAWDSLFTTASKSSSTSSMTSLTTTTKTPAPTEPPSQVVPETVLILVGSALHAAVYVWTKAVLKGNNSGKDNDNDNYDNYSAEPNDHQG